MAGNGTRTFQAIDFSINAWFPGIGERFAGIGIPELGVCNSSGSWSLLPYSHDRREECIAGWTPEFMIERMDEAGVEKGGLLACWAAEGLGGADCRVEADEVYSAINKHPRRFFGMVGVSPHPGRTSKYYPRSYIRYAVQQLGFKGVHMYPHWFGVKINDKAMYPIYETCAALDVPFCFQLGTGTWMSYSRICELPVWIDDVARDFPELRIVGIHGAGAWERFYLELMAKDLNLYWGLDASPPSTWSPRGLPELLQLENPRAREAFKAMKQNYHDKIFWGTDFPVQDWKTSLDEFDALGLPEDIARKVLRDNCARIFKLEN